ncbi:MAG: hypothetical protein M3P46_06750, partial [Actinomycetota bacterium]|nr:hypothetical protein [Actinomycetota bacterium]
MRQELLDDRVGDGLAVLERLVVAEAVAFAARVRCLAELAGLSERAFGADGVERFLALDVAGTLRVGQGTAG